jgi:CheY-like chemotaxis protein
VDQETTARHWLVNAAQRGGLEAAAGARLRPDEPITSAWVKVDEELGLAPGQLADAVAKAFKLRNADVANRDRSAPRLLTEDLARKFLVLPIRQTDRALFVATANPVDFEAESEIRFISGRDTEFEVASPHEILNAINETWSSEHNETVLLTNKALDEATAAVQISGAVEAGPGPLEVGRGPGPAIKLTNLILYQAARASASAILLEPQRNGGRVRINTDSGVTTLLTLPRAAMRTAVDRIRTIAGYGGNGTVLGTPGEVDALISGIPYQLRIVRTTEGGEEKILIHLNAATTAARAGTPVESKTHGLGGPAGDSRPLVLVVDDDESARLLLRTVLEGNGFRVIEAPDGPPALEILGGDADVSLMILDLQMPEMPGLEVLKRVRAEVRTMGLPVVVMTASENPADELALFEAGADDYLRKPVHPPRMTVRIRAVLRRAGLHVEH